MSLDTRLQRLERQAGGPAALPPVVVRFYRHCGAPEDPAPEPAGADVLRVQFVASDGSGRPAEGHAPPRGDR
ncbi:MAG TPA: hypothetical protein VGR27_09925 [Longimicrobiaceae bacterium]|nr:hypothetical protein [Longimicrobiaceae bacterium]